MKTKPKPAKATRKQLRERYAAHKDRVRRAQSETVKAGQDIGPLPPIKEPARRQAATRSLKTFCETYFPDIFYLAWSRDQLTAIDRLETIANEGGQCALAMPRGSGKSALARAAILWAVFTGRRRFAVLIAANAPRALEELAKIKTVCETNAALIGDFPEILFPIHCLARITQRQKGQTFCGQHTAITWLDGKLIFPTIAGSQASGSIIAGCGLQGGAIRGLSHQTSRGKLLRPDFALPDDPQTRASATSDLQCERRETLINSDMMGTAGPKNKLAALCCCTVIRRGDLADRLLDRKKNPQWNGLRMKLLDRLPDNLELWAQYAECRANRGQAEATQLYLGRQAEFDAGAEATWPARFNADQASAVQFAMDLRYDAPETFASEYQNDPLEQNENPDRPTLEQLSSRLNRLPRGTLPVWATKLVVFIDVQERALYWQAAAASEDFTAAVVDRGNEPEQPLHYFALRDVQHTLTKQLAAAGKAGGIEAAIYYGLEQLTDRLFSRAWPREKGGTELRIDRILIDSGDQTKTVYEFCRRSKWSALLLPSKGAGITAGKAPIERWKIQTHEKRGDGYVITSDAAVRAVRLLRFDTNHWKTFVCRRAAVAGGPGSLTIWGDDTRAQRMLQDHANAETCVETKGPDGRTVWEWSLKPGGPDNHHLDTLVGCYVALATVGCHLAETRPPVIERGRIPDHMIAGSAR